MEGLTGTDLAAAALMMPGGRKSCLPRGISSSDAGSLLRSCDRRTGAGRRDYAVILTLLRLGLRAGEVAGLCLDDIDWRSGELVVCGKAARADRLPLVADVGEAIAAYLRHGRPAATRREVFLRAVAPVAPLGRGGVPDIVLRACARAGIAPVRAHRLRRTVACEMVAAGVSLILGEDHLHAVLTEYQVHYNTARPHQGIAQRVPDGDHLTVADLDRGRIHRKPVLGGLINEYSRAA